MSTHVLEPTIFSQRNLSKESYGRLAKANPNVALFGTFKSSVPQGTPHVASLLLVTFWPMLISTPKNNHTAVGTEDLKVPKKAILTT